MMSEIMHQVIEDLQDQSTSEGTEEDDVPVTKTEDKESP